MLDFVDVEQNSDEWFSLRAGKLTASNFGKVMANDPKAFGDPAKKLAVSIAVETITGSPISGGFSNEHTDRGHQQEPIARAKYEAETFSQVSNGGFFHSDFIGCSPDGLVDDDGVIEIKSVVPAAHYANIKRGSFDPAYKWQCIGNLFFTGRKWLDFISYCADFPPDQQLYIFRLNAGEYDDEVNKMLKRFEQYESFVKQTRRTILNSNYMIF